MATGSWLIVPAPSNTPDITKAKSAIPMTKIKTMDFSLILPNMAINRVF